jgi:hypothetical protein
MPKLAASTGSPHKRGDESYRAKLFGRSTRTAEAAAPRKWISTAALIAAEESNHAQAEMMDHRLEIPVSMKQDMTVNDAKRADDQVDRLAYADSVLTHQAKIAGGLNRQLRIEHRFDTELTQVLLDRGGMAFVARALQHLEQNQIADDNILRILDRAELTDRSVVGIAKMSDPDRAIDDDHSAS